MNQAIAKSIRSIPLLSVAWVVRFLSKLPLRQKVGMITILSTFIVCVITAYVILTSYEKERVTYVFETHQHSVAAAAANINSAIRSQLAILKYEVLPDIPEGLTKIPDSAEIAFAIDPTTRDNIVYTRNSNTDLVKYRVPPKMLSDILGQTSNQRILIVNQEGKILAATKDRKPQGKMREAIANYIHSGSFVEGTSLIHLNGNRTAVSHLEIRNSNLIVLALTNIDSITQDLLKTIARWLFIALPIFTFSAFFQSVYISKITAPLYHLIDRFTEISQGKFDRPPEISEGEFQPIMLGAAEMQRAIRDREERLGILSMGLRKLMEIGQNRRNLIDSLSIVYAVVDSVSPMLSSLQTTPTLWVDSESEGAKSITFKGHHITHRTYTGEDRVDLVELNRFLDATIQFSKDIRFTKAYFAERVHVMIIPFRLESVTFGYLLLPIKIGLYHKEMIEFANLIFRTVESIYIENKAEEIKVSSLLLNNELTLARSIQEKTVAVQGEIEGADVEWLFNPAQVVGGDLLMIYQYSDHNMINFYLGDVTGHGIDSAFHTSLAAGAIDFYESQLARNGNLDKESSRRTDLATFAPLLSNLLRNKGNGKHMSLCAGTLFVNTGELYLVLAGHPPPLILDNDFNLKSVQFSSKSVGLIGEVDFPEHPEVIKISLSKGDSIFFYTDGLLENAMTASGLSLNRKKLSKKLAELFRRRRNGDFEKNQLPKVLMDWTKQDFDSYQMNDDVAILLIHYE